MRWIDTDAVAGILGVKRRTVLERRHYWPDFPTPFKTGLRSSPLWKESDIHEWMELQRQRAGR